MPAPQRHITQADQANAQRLRTLWDARKRALKLTQTKAAHRMGFSYQSTVSQYLNGQIALNTDATLAFARLLDVAPSAIDPTLTQRLPEQRNAAQGTVECIGTMVVEPDADGQLRGRLVRNSNHAN